jgi:hypothetical protein
VQSDSRQVGYWLAAIWLLAPALPSYFGAKQRWATSIALLSVWWGESKRTGATGLVSELALPRVGETLELQEGPWHTGATHSHQQTCIEHVELDVNDHPEREPQNGQ